MLAGALCLRGVEDYLLSLVPPHSFIEFQEGLYVIIILVSEMSELS